MPKHMSIKKHKKSNIQVKTLKIPILILLYQIKSLLLSDTLRYVDIIKKNPKKSLILWD